ncbi:MAG: hydantoinase/oxoprolinase family protein [Salinirussus sp.]
MYHAGIDIGGTFTDLVAFDPDKGDLVVEKVASTPADPSIGLRDGVDALELDAAGISRLVHGTTVATNAVLERKGSPCGLLATAGFADVLELGRRDRPNLWGLGGTYEPLIPRERAIGVEERIGPDGTVITPLDEADVRDAAAELKSAGAETVVISFLHAYANPKHERAASRILEEVWPNDNVVASSEVLPEFREFPRASTTTVEGYTRPVIASYLDRLEDRLAEVDIDREMLIMQSNGGLASASVTRDRAARTLLSGPAGGATAAAHVAELTGNTNVISCDMGGTSFDVAILPDGDPLMTQAMELDFQVPVRLPMIEISTIGAGGGSIARVDEGGILRTGPESAGADPGPVCYGKGGTDVTITDANLHLRRIDPAAPIGGDIDLDVERTHDAIATDIASPLDLGVDEAARAVIDVGVDKMVGQLRELSVGRGHDPREFTIVAFGGAGPLHAGELLSASHIPRAIVPYYPGILSALGCVIADSRHDLVRSVNDELEELDLGAYHSWIDDLEAEGRELLAGESGVEEVGVQYHSDMKYAGQSHTVTVPLNSAKPDRPAIRERFRETYLEHYSEAVDAPIRIDNIQVTVIGHREPPDMHRFVRQAGTLSDARIAERSVHFDDEWRDTPIYDRESLPTGTRFEGPAIIAQDDATTVVNPGLSCEIDEYGNAVLEAEA